MSCRGMVEGFMSMHNGVNQVEKENGKNKMMSMLITVVVLLLLNFVVGPFLWNEVVRKLFPACGKARWFDTVALAILLSLVLPQ